LNYKSLQLAPVRAFLDASHTEAAARVVSFAQQSLLPLPESAGDDAARLDARRIARMLGSGGILDPIDGGDLRTLVITREAVAYASPLADAVVALQALGTAPILGSDASGAVREWVAKAINGDAIAAFAMTEPDAGSDVAAMRTTAVRDGDTYILDGSKTLISNAGIADFYTVFASTNREAGSRGISCFVVPASSQGLRFVGPLVMSAAHPLGEIAFDQLRVPASNRIGAEGGGFKIGMTALDRLRPTVAAAACGFAARALDEAIAHAVTRRQFGEPLATFQLTQQKIARMATDLTAARMLVYRAAWEKDGGADRITMEAAMAKSFATEAAQRIIDDAVQIVGGRGVLADHPVDRLYRSVRALRIYEGTTEIQHLIIAGLLIKDAQ
jgi:alkylation response protein AidB-like acyl-CoA dehydrogenase